MANYIAAIFSLTMAVIVVTNVLIPTANDANTTGWDAGSIALFSVFTLISVMGLVYSAGTVFGLL